MIVVKAIEAFAVVMIAFILGWALVDWSEVKELRRKAEYYEKAYEQARDHNDIFPESRHEYIGLAIEMKYNGGKTTPDQEKWLKMLERNGWTCWVCDGYLEALNVLDWYYDDKPRPGPNENRYLKRKAG